MRRTARSPGRRGGSRGSAPDRPCSTPDTRSRHGAGSPGPAIMNDVLRHGPNSGRAVERLPTVEPVLPNSSRSSRPARSRASLRMSPPKTTTRGGRLTTRISLRGRPGERGVAIDDGPEHLPALGLDLAHELGHVLAPVEGGDDGVELEPQAAGSYLVGVGQATGDVPVRARPGRVRRDQEGDAWPSPALHRAAVRWPRAANPVGVPHAGSAVLHGCSRSIAGAAADTCERFCAVRSCTPGPNIVSIWG